MVDSKKLKSLISRSGVSQDYVAEKLKIAQSSLNLKLNNKRAFTIGEMFEISEILKIEPKEMQSIFFKS